MLLVLVLVLAPQLHAQDLAPSLETGSVRFTGNTALDSAALLREMDTRPGETFRDVVLNADLRRIALAYDAAGYPFAEVSIADVRIRARGADGTHGGDDVNTGDDVNAGDGSDGGALLVDVYLEIAEGPLFFIDEITVEGNKLTDADVIVRETRIATPARYDPATIGDLVRRLERMQIFSRVEEPQLYQRDSVGGLLLRVTEGGANRFDGVIGYQPPRGTEESGTVTGLVNLGLRNLFGTGRRLDARWERATSEISELELHYLEPWVAGLPVNLSAGLRQRQQDSAYVRRSVEGAATLLWSSDVEVTAGVEQTTVIPSEGVTDIARASTLAGSIELRIDTRDNVYNPRRGITLRNSYSGGSKRSSTAAGETRGSIQRLEIDAEYFQALWQRTVLAFALHGRELRGGDLDPSDLYRLGGARSLRGYREEQFTGTRLGWTSLEFRYSLGRRTFAFVFYDFAYIAQSPDPLRNRQEFSALRGGYGIGGRLETGLGILGVSYALGEGDGLGDGKIHFGLVNEF